MAKVLLVTGGSRGIGAATALVAARAGYAVCVNYRRADAEARRVVAAIEAGGGRAFAVQADISVDADVIRMFEACDREPRPAVGPRQQRRHPRDSVESGGEWTWLGSSACLPPTCLARSRARERLFAGCRPSVAARAEPSSMCRRPPPASVPRGSMWTTRHQRGAVETLTLGHKRARSRRGGASG